MKKIIYMISILLIIISLSIVPLQAVNLNNDIDPLATTAGITIYFETSSGSRLSGIVRIYFPNGGYSDYTIPTNGKRLTGLSVGTIYGFNLMVDGYAQLSYQFAPTIASNYSEEFIFYPYSHYPDFEPALASYTAPSTSQNQHFGYRNNGGQDFHTGVDFSRDADGMRFHEMNPAPTIFSVCSGSIQRKTFISGCGKVVQVKYTGNNDTYYVSYLHLASYSCGSVGSTISQGSAIGVIGATLNSEDEDDPYMSKHLHLSISTSTSVAKTPGYFLDPIAFEVYEE